MRHPNEDVTPLVGEEVKLWRKPNTDQVNIYVKGTVGGEGLIGFIENEQIANHLSVGGQYKAVISRFDYNYLYLSLALKDEYKTLEDYREEQKEKWEDEILKPYKPKLNWEVVFDLSTTSKKDKNIALGYNSKKDLNFNELNSNIWLQDDEGNIISITNKSGSATTIKTLRALYSDYRLNLEFSRKEYGHYYFTVYFTKIDDSVQQP